MKILDDTTRYWAFALSIATLQNGIAFFALYSSHRDILSDGACIGGIFGTLANHVILAVAVIWAGILAYRSFRDSKPRPALKPVLAVVLSSTTAIVIGLQAGLRCTV